MSTMSTPTTDALSPWAVSGSYYEVCNCEAICPCRRSRGEKGSRPTYDLCDFALSWWIKQGRAGALFIYAYLLVEINGAIHTAVKKYLAAKKDAATKKR